MLVDTLSVATHRQRSIPSHAHLCEWQSSTVPLNCGLYSVRKNVWHLSDECILLFKWICVWNRCLSWEEQKEMLSDESCRHLRDSLSGGELHEKRETILMKDLQQITSLRPHKASICNSNRGQKSLKMFVPNLVCLIFTEISRWWRSVCTEVVGCNYKSAIMPLLKYLPFQQGDSTMSPHEVPSFPLFTQILLFTSLPSCLVYVWFKEVSLGSWISWFGVFNTPSIFMPTAVCKKIIGIFQSMALL